MKNALITHPHPGQFLLKEHRWFIRRTVVNFLKKKLASQIKTHTILSHRLWRNAYSRSFSLDTIDFGLNFDVQNFAVEFNPKFPIAVLKYDYDLWMIILPGKIRSNQGQILFKYNHRIPENWYLENCQWNPAGTILLLICKPESIMTAKCQYFAVLFVLNHSRSSFTVSEIYNSYQLIPSSTDLMQLSSNLNSILFFLV